MRVKLGDICEIVGGGTPKSYVPEYWGGDVKWITPAELNEDAYVLYDSVRKITELGVQKTGLTSFPAGTVILSSRAPIGKVAIAGCEMYCNQGFKNLICSDVINNKYLFWFLKGKTDYLNSLGRGATFKEISKQIIANIEIELPPIEKQVEIADQFEMITSILRHRHEQLSSFDDLIKARFVEMFGDPEINPYGWLKTSIASVLNGKASNGYFAKREEYVDNGNVAILGVAYVVNRMYSQVEGLPRTNASEADIRKFQVRYGDMLFCRSSLVAEGIGKASIVPDDVPLDTLFECHVIRIPLDLKKCVPEFVQVLSSTSYFRKQMIAQSKTATMTTIGQDGILKANIILPPIEKQHEFYTFVKQVDKSKFI